MIVLDGDKFKTNNHICLPQSPDLSIFAVEFYPENVDDDYSWTLLDLNSTILMKGTKSSDVKKYNIFFQSTLRAASEN